MVGKNLSHYKITAELGRGGMGIVYEAEDTKLDRTVAIKVLPSAALASEEDRERFYREAKAAAQLHHPNIASVFEIDEAVPEGSKDDDLRPFIAMEHIEGGTLYELIRQAPLPLADAVKITSQVAEALRAAHAKEIVHRDIKSANVMITLDGIAKVLDFGLAKTNQSTMLTRMGSTLGTVAYMSPEQARGQQVDGRTDLYSLGTMLYEMVAGQLPFAGEYEQAVVYSILNEPPEPLTALRTGVPMQLEWIVNKLLSKEADYRYQTAADLLADLKSLDLSGSGTTRRSMPAMSAITATDSPLKQPRSLWMYGAIVAALLIGVAGTWIFKPGPARQDSAVFRFELQLESFADRTGRHSVAISPDGRFIAYVVSEGIRIRRSNDLTSSTLVELETAREVFFSPDSRWLAFEDDSMNRLMRIGVEGGAVTRIADLPGGLYGASWAPNFDIFLGLGADGMGRIPSGNGAIEKFVGPDSTGLTYHNPRLLPDGHTIVYTRGSGVDEDETEIRLHDLDTGAEQLIPLDGKDAHYVNSGHLVAYWNNTLYAMPFDATRNQPTGTPVPVAEQITGSGFSGLRPAQFDISEEGTLVAIKSSLQGESDQMYRLDWMSPDETSEPLSPELKDWFWPEISPDGSKVAVENFVAGMRDIWILDVEEGTPIRLTSNGRSTDPVWSPEGDRVAYRDENVGILVRYPADLSRVDTLWTESGIPTDWSLDGQFLIYDAGTRTDRIMSVLELEKETSSPFLENNNGEQNGNVSPNGRWLAYELDGEGGDAVYVRPFPSGGDALLISEGVGKNPHWSADGNRIYFASSLSDVSMSEFDPVTGVAQIPKVVPTPSGSDLSREFDVHPDGRILTAVDTGIGSSAEEGDFDGGSVLKLVTRFDAELRSRAPGDS